MSAPLLSARHVSKSLSRRGKGLVDVQLDLYRGEIHALMGENGAGKSTCIKIITGVYERDEGTVLFKDREIHPRSPKDAEAVGISTVYQEVNLIPTLSIAENVMLGRLPRKFGVIQWRAAREQARQAVQRLGLDLDVSRELSSCSIAIQQMIAIARALDVRAELLVLDEPTSSLDAEEVEALFKVLRQLRDEGLAIMFVSHFLDQIYALTDRLTVLRNGQFVGEYMTAALPRIELLGKMLGRAVEADHVEHHGAARPGERRRRDAAGGCQGYRTQGERWSGGCADRQGRGGGPGGTARLGAHRDGAYALWCRSARERRSARQRREGAASDAGRGDSQGLRLLLGGSQRRRDSPPAFRARESHFRHANEPRPAAANSTRRADATRGTLHPRAQHQDPGPETPIRNLSGGNQQKVLLARWLAVQPRLIILDEPTRGIDVGAKAEIEKLIGSLREQGMSVLFISSELEEVVRVSGRVVVLRDRKKIGELDGEFDENRVLHLIAQPLMQRLLI